MTAFSQTKLSWNRFNPFGSLQTIADSGDWVYIGANDLDAIRVQIDTSAPFDLSNRTMVAQSFSQLTLQPSPGFGAPSLLQVVYGRGTPPSIPSVKDVTRGLAALSDISCAALAQTAILPVADNPLAAIFLAVPTGAAGPLRIGDAGTSFNSGIVINAGASPLKISPCPVGALFAYNNNASAVTLTRAAEYFT